MSNDTQRPWLDTNRSIEERLDALLPVMTLDECIAQLDQVRIDEVSNEELKTGVGSVILAQSATAGNDAQDASSAELVDRLQKVVIDESRLGIPLITGRDVIHGHHTVFPIPLGQGASWDRDLVHDGCRAAAVEASADGVHWTFSPMLDICRDPRWGRIAEGYGESPLLTAELGVAAVAGYQGDDLSAPDAIAACAKHYVGYGAAEGGRDYNTTEISWSSLEDSYLPPFEAAVAAGCQTIMSSFNAIDGIPLAGHRQLLTEVLRDRWGFDGFVVTDWNAVAELIAHGVAADGADAAAQCVEAGADMNMVDRLYVRHLPQLLEAGLVDEAVVRLAARRILAVKMRLGLFEQPYTGSRSVDRGPHLELAREAAARCAVLLQNDGILPFGEPEDEQKYGKMKIGGIAVVGPLAEATGALFGTWTLDGNPGEVTSLADALDAALDGQVKRAPWDNPSLCAHMVHQSAAAVVVLGETPNRSGEANSVADPGLPPGQVAMLEQLLALGTPIVLVVIAGRPICLPDCVERCAAVLYSFHPGTGGGLGLADVLTGAAEPGGRLPVTLPRHPGQIPLYHDHKPTGRPLDEYHRPKDQAGFYRLLDCRGDPRWPFGAGMSYTSFSVSAPSLLDASLDDGIHCRVSVSNTGPRSGSTVVQAYLRDPVAERSQPVRKLAAWERVHLAAGSTTEIDLHLPATSLRYHHRDGSIRADAGLFQVWVGQHTSDGACLDVSISE